MNRDPDYYERHDKRPWPVSPRQYPLKGPDRGSVYCPPHADPRPISPLAALGWCAVGAMYATGTILAIIGVVRLVQRFFSLT